MMRAARLQDALERLTAAFRNVEAELAAMKAEHDPLATHIFLSRRNYRNANDTKGGKRREINARLSFNTACELGFRGSLDEWERLIGASREALNAYCPGVGRARGVGRGGRVDLGRGIGIRSRCRSRCRCNDRILSD